MAKKKEELTGEVTLINIGSCLIIINRTDVMPDCELSVPIETLELDGIKSLISDGKLIVKDNADMTNRIKKEMQSRSKKDSKAPKTLAELEDGGVY